MCVRFMRRAHRNARAATKRAEGHGGIGQDVRAADDGNETCHVPQSPAMTWMLLARHGETDWNREGRWQGHANVTLNDRGREQARALARRLERESFDVIYASDLARAHETALIIAESRRMPVVTDPGLREIDVGSWSGLTPDQIAEKFPGMVDHDGETNEQHLARVLACFTRIARARVGQRVLVVSHGKTLRVIRRHAAGKPVALLGNCETGVLRWAAERFETD